MEPISRTLHSFDWITLVIFSSLLFLVVAKRYFYSRFLNFMILPFNNKYIFMYNKKDLLLNGFQFFFTFFQLLNFALFIYLAYGVVSDTPPLPPVNYLTILGISMAFILVKIFLQMGNSAIFNNSKVVTELIFKKLSYFNYCGLVLVLANIILTYVLPTSKVVVYVGILLFLIINTAGWITLIKNHQKLITSYFFYFILYLCALEIAPLVLIVNALTYRYI